MANGGLLPSDSSQSSDHIGWSKNRRYDECLVAGYNLWRAGHYGEAWKHFEAVSAMLNRGPAASVLLAHCQAMLGQYAACTSTLSRALSSEMNHSAASDLHEAFVMWKCGLYVDARTDLEKVVREHIELPSPCLILADLLIHSGNHQVSANLLKLAIKRDRKTGTIAEIARQRLTRILRI